MLEFQFFLWYNDQKIVLQKHLIFGQRHIAECAARFPIGSTAQIPIGPALAALCDQGGIDVFTGNWLDQLTQFMIQ